LQHAVGSWWLQATAGRLSAHAHARARVVVHACVQARAKKLPLRVSAISPGLVETDFFTTRAFGDAVAAAAATSAMQCLQPSDIAAAILWCLAAPAHMEINDVIIRPTQQAI
jgi:NADP-dependent 3-hydroxy acid dehydrogenase YdfG